MNILRGGKTKPFSVRKLSEEDKKRVEQCEDMRCGLSGWFSKYVFDVPDLIFKFDCKMHDLGTRRGGGLLDFIDNIKIFAWYLFLDVTTVCGEWLRYALKRPFVNMTLLLPFVLVGYSLLLTVALVYLIIATLGTIVVFHWGKYQTLDEILLKAKCK